MNLAKDTSQNFFTKARIALSSGLRHTGQAISRTKTRFLKHFTHWIDPKLAKYRTREPNHYAPESNHHTPELNHHTPSQNPDFTEVDSTLQNHTPAPHALIPTSPQHTPRDNLYTPENISDFMALLKRTPRNVLNSRERHVIATIMNFPNIRVHEIMLPQSAITYVKDDEVLGPLTLDRLYRSGFQHFPVINPDRRIIGIIHTTALNSLEIKETSHAYEILDPKVYYLREDYTLNQALAAFLRTNCYFFLVIDRYERILGMLTYQMLVDYLLGETPTDDFDRDSDRLAVAKRVIQTH